jgi:hypothetical protein
VREAELKGTVRGYFGSEQPLVNEELRQAIALLLHEAEGMHINHHDRYSSAMRLYAKTDFEGCPS